MNFSFLNWNLIFSNYLISWEEIPFIGYSNKYWIYFSNIISIVLIMLFIFLLGMLFLQKAKHVKILNLISAFYLIIYFFLTPLEYTYFFEHIGLINTDFNQNTTFFVYLFITIATFVTIFFFLGISNIYYIEENSKIEYTFLIWFIYGASIFLISSTDFISIIILLECIAFSSYVLVGFERQNKFSTTSALKYLILASIPSCFFILGISLLYNTYGTFSQNYLNLLLQGFNNYKLFEKQFIIENEFISLFWQYINEFYFNQQFLQNTITSYNLTENNLLEIFYEYAFNVNKLCTYFNPYLLTDIWQIEELLLFESFWRPENPEHPYGCFEYVNYFTYKLNIQAYIIVLRELFTFKYFWEIFFLQKYINIFNSNGSILEEINSLNMVKFGDFKTFHVLSLCEFEGILNWFRVFSYSKFVNKVESFSEYPHLANMCKIWMDGFLVTDFQLINGLHLRFLYDNAYNFNSYLRMECPCDVPEWEKLVDYSAMELHETLKYYLQNKFSNEIFNNALNLTTDQGNMYTFLTSFLQQYDNFSNVLFFLHKPALNNYTGFLYEYIFDLGGINSFLIWTKFVEFNSHYNDLPLIVILALIFISINLFFKLTAAPFHFWAPTVYGGSPLPTLTFLSIFSKLTIFFFIMWVFINILDIFNFIWQPVFFLIAFLSIVFSILGAFSEKIFKRFFVYSSTGHVGFMLLGIASLNIEGLKSAIDYLIIYIVSSFIIWFIILHLTKKTTTLINLKGLAFNNAFLSLIFAIVIFSLSGIPPLGGFFVKYEIFSSLIQAEYHILALFLLLMTVISFFYYLRVIKIIFFENNKIYIKNKNLSDIKLRLISYSFFILPLYFIFINTAVGFVLKNILINSLF